jgi:hypothetical protein
VTSLSASTTRSSATDRCSTARRSAVGGTQRRPGPLEPLLAERAFPPLGCSRRWGMGQRLHVYLNVLTANDGRCAYCGAVACVLEHVVPRAIGGADTWRNLVPSCDDCNARKGKRTPVEWVLGREMREAWRLNEQLGVREAYEAASREVEACLRRVEAVQAEICAAPRRRWFHSMFSHRGKPRNSADLEWLRSFAAEESRKAREEGYPSPSLWLRGTIDWVLALSNAI